MSLGFSVEALVPRARGGGALRMGLVRLGEDAWLQPRFDRAARRAAFAAHPGSVRLLRHGEDAAREAAGLIGAGATLGGAAVAVWEDLCVLTPAADGLYRLTAAAVAFPTDWRIEDKLGLALTAVHAPIHGYAEQLASGVDHFMATLPVGPIYGRANRFVVDSDAWRYLPTGDPATRFGHVTSANAGDTLFVRCERQTLRRLPDSHAILFTIGVQVAPLGTLGNAVVRRIAQAINTTGAGEHARRVAPFYADALALYAAARADAGEY